MLFYHGKLAEEAHWLDSPGAKLGLLVAVIRFAEEELLILITGHEMDSVLAPLQQTAEFGKRSAMIATVRPSTVRGTNGCRRGRPAAELVARKATSWGRGEQAVCGLHQFGCFAVEPGLGLHQV